MKKSILLGLHNDYLLNSIETFCESFGYSVEEVRDFPDLLNKMHTREYDKYLIDLNLGFPGSEDITPAITVFDAAKERITQGQASFLGVSGNENTLKLAESRGIKDVCDIVDLTEKLAGFLEKEH